MIYTILFSCLFSTDTLITNAPSPQTLRAGQDGYIICKLPKDANDLLTMTWKKVVGNTIIHIEDKGKIASSL